MQFIDTHSHIYLPEFDSDRDEVIARSIEAGVNRIFLPNIDRESVSPMLSLSEKYSGICYPMMGLHPTSVTVEYESQLEDVDRLLEDGGFIAVGEVGIDLYWDRTLIEEQKKAFNGQVVMALKYGLPLVIHTRESFNEVFEILESNKCDGMKGVFHAFTGNREQALRAIEMGFYIGIGGIVTFKNSGLDRVVAETGINRVLLESDSPYLTPSPNRGKRNESAYVKHTAEKIASVCNLDLEVVAATTTENALKLFNLTADAE